MEINHVNDLPIHLATWGNVGGRHLPERYITATAHRRIVPKSPAANVVDVHAETVDNIIKQ